MLPQLDPEIICMPILSDPGTGQLLTFAGLQCRRRDQR